MKDYNEGNNLWEQYILYNMRRLYELKTFLSCFLMYLQRINSSEQLLALPAPSDVDEQGDSLEDVGETSDSSVDETLLDEPQGELSSSEQLLALPASGDVDAQGDSLEDVGETLESAIDEPSLDDQQGELDSLSDGEVKENQTLKNLQALLKETSKKAEELTPDIYDKPHIEPSALIIKNLVKKFLKLHFKAKESELNFRSKNEADKVHGYYYWDKKLIAKHLATKDYFKVLNDKYDIQYGSGRHESVPLALYFDLSPSMSDYSSIMAEIALELLRNNVKVLIGYNNWISYQINKTDLKATSEDLKTFFENSDSKLFEYEEIDEDISVYLKSKQCEKCIVVSDNDSILSVEELSDSCEVYLLYCLNYGVGVGERFKGVHFNITSEEDMMDGLLEMSMHPYRVLKAKCKSRSR